MQQGEAFEGLFCLLPKWHDIPETSIVHQQEHLNPGFAGHYTLIAETLDNGRIARCLQCTSFTKPVTYGHGSVGKRQLTAMQKYPTGNINNILRCQLLPVFSNPKSETHDNMPLLKLQDDPVMAAQTYVKLDHYFEIETSLLIRWSQNHYALTEDSLCRLVHHFHNFVSGYTNRVEWIPGRPRSPMDIYGPPVLTDRSHRRATRGYQLAVYELQQMAETLAYHASQQYQPPPMMMHHGQRLVTPDYSQKMVENLAYHASLQYQQQPIMMHYGQGLVNPEYVQHMAESLAYNASQQYQPQLMMHHGQMVVRPDTAEQKMVPAPQVEVSSRGGVTFYGYAGMAAA